METRNEITLDPGTEYHVPQKDVGLWLVLTQPEPEMPVTVDAVQKQTENQDKNGR